MCRQRDRETEGQRDRKTERQRQRDRKISESRHKMTPVYVYTVTRMATVYGLRFTVHVHTCTWGWADAH